MNIDRHGLSIGIERSGSDFFMSLKVIGKLTHEDYRQITPLIDSALAELSAPQVDAFVDLTEFEGWALRAAWDDFKLGLKHGNAFRRIAMVGSRRWQEWAAKVGSWFISGEIRYFEEREAALDWLKSDA